MTLDQVLKNKIFDFPLESAKYFPEYLADILQQYLELLKRIDDEFSSIIKENLSQIESLCTEILEINSCVFKGNATEAYSKFSKVIQSIESYLKYPNKNFQPQIPTSLYKARNRMESKFGAANMFHVPFEKRYHINTTRFSLTGVPCLYLSNSIYTCWEELDRPVFSQMPVSRFEITGKNLRFLDLSNNAEFIRRSLVMDNEYLTKSSGEKAVKSLIEQHKELIEQFVLPRFINTFPLYAACYIRVNDSTAHFKPEYIFPQMLMQWIMAQDEIDGIKYLSTKCKSIPPPSNLEPFLNYAIPVKSFQETGYCNILSESLSLTEPITYELLNILDPAKASTPIDYEKDFKGKFHPPPIFFIKLNHKINKYLETSFGILEYELLNTPVKKLGS